MKHAYCKNYNFFVFCRSIIYLFISLTYNLNYVFLKKENKKKNSISICNNAGKINICLYMYNHSRMITSKQGHLALLEVPRKQVFYGGTIMLV